MFRTREWVMFVSGCTFVLGAIMVTVWSDRAPARTVLPDAIGLLSSAPVSEQQASVVMAESMSTADALQAMRTKVATYRQGRTDDRDRFTVASSVPDTASDSTDDETMDTTTVGPLYCDPSATAYAGTWPRDVLVEEREGVRVVYTANDSLATSSLRLPETLLLQLPAPGRPGMAQRCLPSEVVGVAQDGSLIRNDEVGLYQIFSANTVVGYALDGFPIYGKNDAVQVDACGGAMGMEGYGYVLQSDRESIVHCFRGRPAQL